MYQIGALFWLKKGELLLGFVAIGYHQQKVHNAGLLTGRPLQKGVAVGCKPIGLGEQGRLLEKKDISKCNDLLALWPENPRDSWPMRWAFLRKGLLHGSCRRLRLRI
eukprot:XP_001708902.1 Hypothetical protein GL50803_20061 [Giardia lamblia ATCC 50803]